MVNRMRMNIVNAWIQDGKIIVALDKGAIMFTDKTFHCSENTKIVWFRFEPEYGISTVQKFPDGEVVACDYSIDDIINAILH